MSEPLVTTCGGYSLQKVGGRCTRRDECRRYIERKPEDKYPQESYLCRVGSWNWFYPAEEKKND